jgi:hypothetical protein
LYLLLYILSFVHSFLTLFCLLLFPMLSKHSERLTDSPTISISNMYMYIVPVVCRFAHRTITSSTTLKSSVDNTSPCLNPCRVSKDSEQSFCSLSGGVLFFVHLCYAHSSSNHSLFACFLVKPMGFVTTLWIVSSSFLHFSSKLSG